MEVLIVVFGIVIGLQVNGWNEDHKNFAGEQLTTERLYTEVTIALDEVSDLMAEPQFDSDLLYCVDVRV